MNEKDTGRVPGKKWKFDAKVADVFEDMLERSIPQYDVMRKAVADVGRSFIKTDSTVVDLGCSAGDALASFVVNPPAFGIEFLGLEESKPMVTVATRRFAGRSDVAIRLWDLRGGFPPVRASLVLSVLTLQFVPINYRQKILTDAHTALVDGGALILVEKVLGNTAAIDKTMVDLYHRMKKENGYTDDAIERKKLALEGVLVPLTAHFNEELLRSAGFSRVDCFWRWMNFAAWVAVK